MLKTEPVLLTKVRKRMLTKPFLILVCLFTFGILATASAQMENRIRFAKGKDSAVVTGLTGTNGIFYIVKAKGGQKVILKLSPLSDLGIKVEKDGTNGHEVLLREEHGGTFEIYLEENGDISIFLGSINGKSIPYNLSVKITQSKSADI